MDIHGKAILKSYIEIVLTTETFLYRALIAATIDLPYTLLSLMMI